MRLIRFGEPGGEKPGVLRADGVRLDVSGFGEDWGEPFFAADGLSRLRLWLDVNGERVQDSSTSDLIFGVPRLVAYVSRCMTLLPGDVISTGTPAGVGLGFDPPRYLRPGDVVELGIDGLGTSRQRAAARAAPAESRP